MKAGSSSARFQGRWEVRIEIEPGSVPDRLVRYSSVPGASYRPARLVLVFETSVKAALAGNTFALRMENGSGAMKQAALSVTVSSATIYGNRLKKDGTPGQQEVDEKFYSSSLRFSDSKAPEWVLAAVRERLTDLGGQA